MAKRHLWARFCCNGRVFWAQAVAPPHRQGENEGKGCSWIPGHADGSCGRRALPSVQTPLSLATMSPDLLPSQICFSRRKANALSHSQRVCAARQNNWTLRKPAVKLMQNAKKERKRRKEQNK